MVEAGAHAVLHGPVGAAAQGKGPVQQLPGLAGGQRGREGPEIAGPVAPGLAHHLQTGEGMLDVHAEEHVLLVVAQHDIVMGPVFLDEAGFQQQGFLFRGGGQEFDALRMGQHGFGLGGQAFGAEIGEHASAQDARLAHIDDLALAVPVQIDTGRERDGRRIGFLHGPMLQAGAGQGKPWRDAGSREASLPLPVSQRTYPTDS